MDGVDSIMLKQYTKDGFFNSEKFFVLIGNFSTVFLLIKKYTGFILRASG